MTLGRYLEAPRYLHVNSVHLGVTRFVRPQSRQDLRTDTRTHLALLIPCETLYIRYIAGIIKHLLQLGQPYICNQNSR